MCVRSSRDRARGDRVRDLQRHLLLRQRLHHQGGGPARHLRVRRRDERDRDRRDAGLGPRLRPGLRRLHPRRHVGARGRGLADSGDTRRPSFHTVMQKFEVDIHIHFDVKIFSYFLSIPFQCGK